MPFSPCERVIERVSAVVDGEVGTVDRWRFHAHLAICPPCRRYFRQFVAVHRLGAQPGREDLPEDFDEVMAFVLDKVQEPAGSEHGDRSPPK